MFSKEGKSCNIKEIICYESLEYKAATTISTLKKLPVALNCSKFYKELALAAAELGRLDSLQRSLPDSHSKLILSQLLTNEGEANLQETMMWGVKTLFNRKLNLSLIKDLHARLQDKTQSSQEKWKFRKEIVYVAMPYDRARQRTYVPPGPLVLNEYMDNLESYLLKHQEIPLVKIGIFYSQFEAIHPFAEGNSSTGRVVIPLFLYQENELFKPALCLSRYFDERKKEFLEALHNASMRGEYESWMIFFLNAVCHKARETREFICRMADLINHAKSLLKKIKSPYADNMLNFMFENPTFNSADLTGNLKSSRMTAHRLIKTMIAKKILLDISGKRKKKLYSFYPLAELLSPHQKQPVPDCRA